MTGPASQPLTWPDEGVSRVPYRVYADAGIYEREQERIFRGPAWHFLGLESEVAEPCDYKTVQVGETPVILVRGEDGALNAMVNRCVHRGNLVCIKKRGNEGARLTCVYHNWTYDLRGNLASVAFAKGVGGKGGMPEDFDRARHRLRPLRVEAIFGLVFATVLTLGVVPILYSVFFRVSFKEFSY